MLRGKVEGEMALSSEGSSVKGSPEDKKASAPCVKGSAKISWQVTLALYNSFIDSRPAGVQVSETLRMPGMDL